MGEIACPVLFAVACWLRPRLPIAARGSWAVLRGIVLPGAVLVLLAGLVWIRQTQLSLLEWHYTDLPITKLAVVAAAALAVWLIRNRFVPFAVGAAVLAFICLNYPEGHSELIRAERSCFGNLQVKEDPLWNAHVLYCGTTIHGSQSAEASESHSPWGCYHSEGPLGRIFEGLRLQRPLENIGVIGLGVGTMAAYGKAGETMTFFERDPAVVAIAKDPTCFTYLAESHAKTRIVVGDARRLLAKESRTFDLLAVDLFCSATPPLHLLTREAFSLYQDRLAKHGLLVFHISNPYLNLEPILGRLADNAGMAVLVSSDEQDEATYRKLPASWVVMARHVEDLHAFGGNSSWKILAADGGRIWTDDSSNPVEALDWKLHRDAFSLAKWWQPHQEKIAFYRSAGDVLFGKNKLDEALLRFEKVEALSPDDPVAQNSIGLILLRQNKLDLAESRFRKAIDLQTDFADAQANLGMILLSQGKTDEAIAHLEAALQSNPSQFDAHYHLGLAQLRRDSEVEAIPHLNRAVELRPDCIEAYTCLGNVYLRLGEVEQAVASYQKAIELQPKDMNLRESLGDALMAGQDLAGAIAEYRRVLVEEPNRATTHNKLGQALANQNNREEAISHYEKAIGLRSDFVEARSNLGNVLQQQGKTKDAIAQYEKALAQSPKQADVHFRLGMAMESEGKLADAVAHYQKAVELEPRDILATNNLAWLLATCPEAALRQGKKAVELAERMVTMAGDEQPGLLDTLAAAYAEVGRYADAVETARQAVRLAKEKEDEKLVEALKKRLALYKAEKPFHETATMPAK
jgi:tetratricopeptide (TPR) repeat protein